MNARSPGGRGGAGAAIPLAVDGLDARRAGAGPDALVVVGASAGGVEALRALVAGVPADLPAAVLVVLHIPRHAPSALSRILARAGRSPA